LTNYKRCDKEFKMINKIKIILYIMACIILSLMLLPFLGRKIA